MHRALFSLLLALSAMAAPAETGSVQSADGVRIVYDARGKGDTALFFVHCWSCDRTFWRNQVDVFADRYRVVTLDLGGHGQSGKNRSKWTVTGLGADVQAVADHLHLQRIVLVGHSMGGPVSLEAARLLQGRVKGVVAVDTLHDAGQAIPIGQLEAIVAKLQADFAGAMGGFMGSLFAPGADPAVRQFVENKARAADPAIAVALMRDFRNLDIGKMFQAAGVPIRGINAKPPLGPVTNIAGNRKFADFDAVLIENAGHFLQLERPREFNAALARFAAQLGSTNPKTVIR